MRKPNKFLAAGLAVIGLAFILKHSNAGLPDFDEGFMIGVGLALELLGVFKETNGISKLGNFKMKLYNRFFRGNA